MKKLFYYSVVSAFIGFGLTSCKNSSSSDLFSGQVKGGSGKTIYLEQLTSQSAVAVDSAVIDKDDKFSFTHFKPTLNFYRIRIEPQNFAILVLDTMDKVAVTGDAKDIAGVKITGSKETDIFLVYNEISKKYRARIDSLQQKFQAELVNKPDSAKMTVMKQEVDKVYQEILSKWTEELSHKVMENKDKFASIIALQMLDPEKYATIYSELDNQLNAKFPNHPMVQMLHKIVKQQSALAPGTPAPEIALPSPEGKEITLSSLKGKTVLIDFWASWCGPCRAEMPHIVELYKKCKGKNFEILGVSLDQTKDKWIEAIKKDNITWPQVSDLKFWNSVVVSAYNIQSIPYTILVDKNGIIVAKGLKGEELEAKIKELTEQK